MTPSPLELQTDAQYTDFLTHEYGWRIESPWYTTVPQPKEEYVGRNQKELNVLKHYLTETYIIRDQFDINQRARILFLEALQSQNGKVAEWIDQHDKLDINRYSAVSSSLLAILESAPERFPDLGRRLRSAHRSHPFLKTSRYDLLPFGKKATYVRKVDAATYRFLEELGK